MSNIDFIVVIENHRKRYDFSSIMKIVGEKFCLQIMEVWSTAFGANDQGHVRHRFRCVSVFIDDLKRNAEINPKGPQARLLAEFNRCKVNPLTYVEATADFAARLRDRGNTSVVQTKNKSTRNSYIWGLGATFNELARRNIVPGEHGMKTIPIGPFEPRLLTLAELSPDGPIDCSDPRAAFGILLRNQALADRLGLGGVDTSVMGAQELAEAMVKVLNIRIEALRSLSVADLERELALFQEGERIRQRTDLPAHDDFMKALTSWQPSSGIAGFLELLERPPWSALEGGVEKKLTALLVRALVPYFKTSFYLSDLPPKLSYMIIKCGRLGNISRYFEGNWLAKTAAHTIVLIDSLFNVSVCDRLSSNPFTGRISRGKCEIATVEAIKRRAGNKIVHGVLPDDYDESTETCFLQVKRADRKKSSVWALNTWLLLSEPIRARAAEQEQNLEIYLWILPHGVERFRGQVWRPDNQTGIKMFQKFMAIHQLDPIIGGLPITRQMIRISCLQARSGPNDDSGLVMPSLAQHASARTTHSYGNTTWMTMLLAEQVRTFQDLLEAAAGAQIKELAKILGITSAAAISRRNLALQTGLGFFCASPKSGERPGTFAGELCDKLEDCPRCQLHLFVPNPETLEALWLFGKALRDERCSWESTRPGRWKAVWLPWLAIVTATENVINSGRHKVKYDRAAKIAEERLALGDISVPVLW